MYRKILVATDGSEAGTRAVELAGDLSRIHGADVTVLHVINPADEAPDWMHYSDAHALGFAIPPVTPGRRGAESPAAQELQRVHEQARKAAERLLRDSRVAAESKGATNVQTVVDEGLAAERILAMAESEKVDVIVMGNRGYGAFKGLIMGSVSSAVAKKAECHCISIA